MSKERLKTVNHEPLPSEWVDRIFSKLTARFGRDFLSRWEGVDINLVKADWAEELAGLQGRPDAIKYALEHIGGKAPTVDDFKTLCGRAPVHALLRLDSPMADQDVIDRAIAKAQKALRFKGDRLDPIRNLRRRELSGDKTLTKAQREFWRIALASEIEASGSAV